MSERITKKGTLMLLLLSFADPITDILTLMEFYKTGHTNWFTVGMIFIILPCFAFAFSYCCTSCKTTDGDCSHQRCYFDTMCLGGFHPFTVALQRLEAFIVCGKNLWRGETIMLKPGSYEYEKLHSAKLSALYEAVCESAPQFLIQLCVVNVQQEPVSIIQIISLPVSFLSLVWSFKAMDEDDNANMSISHKILSLVTHAFLLSARLFAITYFVMFFKWTSITPIFLHFIFLSCVHWGWPYMKSGSVLQWCFLFCISLMGYETFETDGKTRRGHLLSCYTLTVLENVSMILSSLFVLQKTWYSLPVTVSVCVFSVLGAILRFLAPCHLRFQNITVLAFQNMEDGKYETFIQTRCRGSAWKCRSNSPTFL